MGKMPKTEIIKKKPAPKETANLPTEEDHSWEADQNDRGYYYDDAYGYEKYVPSENEDDNRELPKADIPRPT